MTVKRLPISELIENQFSFHVRSTVKVFLTDDDLKSMSLIFTACLVTNSGLQKLIQMMKLKASKKIMVATEMKLS